MKPCLIIYLFLTVAVGISNAENRKVLLIGIDGLRSDALMKANTPNIKSLLLNGFGTCSSWHQDITISGPSWSSILCGVYHDKHGVLDNSFSGSNYKDYPMLPVQAKKFNPNLKFGMYMEWNKLFDVSINQDWDEMLSGQIGNTWKTQRESSKWLQNSILDFHFVYFGAVDLIGHLSGFSTWNPFYLLSIEQIDRAVGALMKAIHSRPLYMDEDWLIIITTDHGGQGFSHGGLSPAERKLIWIAYSDRMNHSNIHATDYGNINDDCNPYTSPSCRRSPVQVDIVPTVLDFLLIDYEKVDYMCFESNQEGRSWIREMGLNSFGHQTILAYK